MYHNNSKKPESYCVECWTVLLNCLPVCQMYMYNKSKLLTALFCAFSPALHTLAIIWTFQEPHITGLWGMEMQKIVNLNKSVQILLTYIIQSIDQSLSVCKTWINPNLPHRLHLCTQLPSAHFFSSELHIGLPSTMAKLKACIFYTNGKNRGFVWKV